MITFFSWAGIARIVRGQTLSHQGEGVHRGGQSLGAGPLRIMFFDILPNLLAPVLVARHAVHPDGGRLRGDAVLPRPRHPAAHAELGQHPGRRAELLPGRLVVPGLPGAGAADHHAGVQPARRRHQGRDGPADRALIAARRMRRRLTRRSGSKGSKEALGGLAPASRLTPSPGRTGRDDGNRRLPRPAHPDRDRRDVAGRHGRVLPLLRPARSTPSPASSPAAPPPRR